MSLFAGAFFPSLSKKVPNLKISEVSYGGKGVCCFFSKKKTFQGLYTSGKNSPFPRDLITEKIKSLQMEFFPGKNDKSGLYSFDLRFILGTS